MLWDLGFYDMGKRKFPLRMRIIMRPDKYRFPYRGFKMMGVDNQSSMVQRNIHTRSNSLASDRPRLAQPKRRK